MSIMINIFLWCFISDGKYYPCSPDTPGVLQTKITSLPPDQVKTNCKTNLASIGLILFNVLFFFCLELSFHIV